MAQLFNKNPSQPLTNKFRGGIQYLGRFVAKFGWNRVVQANPNNTEPEAITGNVIGSSTTTDRTDEIEKTTDSLGFPGDPQTFPLTITDQKLTEEYGGGVLNVIDTVDSYDHGPPTIDQGYPVVNSQVNDTGSGYEKITEMLNGDTTTVSVTGTLSPNVVGSWAYTGQYNGRGFYTITTGGHQYVMFFTGTEWRVRQDGFTGTLGWTMASTQNSPVGAYTAVGGATGTLNAAGGLNAVGWPTLFEYDQDEETQALITTSFQVVDATTVAAPTPQDNIITSYKRIDKWRSWKIVKTYSTPADRSEYRFMTFSFPSLLRNYSWDSECGAFNDQRFAFSTFVKARVDISFGALDDTIDGFQIIPNSFQLAGFRVSDVLNDALTIVGWGTCTFTATIDASTPSMTDYVSLIGTDQLMSGESVIYKAAIYRTTKLFVRLM